MNALAVSTALHDLYSPQSTPRVRRRADSLLQQFQRSPEAAPAALRVLQAPPVVTGDAQQDAHTRAERAFAATTIYLTAASYVRRYKLEDPASWTEEERAEHARVAKEFGLVCHELWNILTGPHAAVEELNVQTHMALTIAVVLLRFHEQTSLQQEGAEGSQSIVGAVEWLVQNQANPVQDPASAHRTNFAVLLTLKVIPEEVHNKRVKFSKAKRAQCENMVQQSASHVIQNVLPSIASAIDASEDQGRLRGLLLQSLTSWVEYGTVSPSIIMESGLLDRAFRESLSPDCSEVALLVIREVVRACQNDAHVPLMELVMKNFVVLGKLIAERMGDKSSPTSLQASCITGCAMAIAECGQSFITYFVDYTLDLCPGSLVYEFLDTVLFFTSLDDLSISNETMEFWIDFRMYVSGKNEERMYAFDEFISRLLRILVERTEYPAGFETFPEAAKERFALYRNDVRGVFRALATVTVASEDKFIVDAIHLIFRQYEIAKAGPVSPDWWRRTEVYVHALSALSKSIREADMSLVPQLFDYLSQKEPSHRALARTTTVFLGVTGHWFARHPEFLGVFAFRILSNSFEISEKDGTFPFRMRGQEDHVGAVALRKLTSRCGEHFFNQQWMESILHLYRSNRASAGTAAAILGTDSLLLIVDSVAQVLATVNYKDAIPIIKEMTTIMFDDLKARFPTLSASNEKSVDFLCELIEHLRRLATLIPPRIDQETPHPVLVDLQERWDLIETIIGVYGTSEEIVEKFCALLTGIFDSLRYQALALASRIMPTLLAQFALSSDGNYLRVIKSILECAGNDDATAESLTRVVTIVSGNALQKIAEDGSVDNNPSLVMSLLDLIASCGTHHPIILVQSSQLEPVLALVLHTLKTENPEVGAAALDFLLELGSLYGIILRTPTDLLYSPENAGKLMLHQLIQTLFFEKDVQYHLLAGLFNGAAGGMPPTLLDKIAEVVRSCWVYFGRQRSEELLRRLLADDGYLGPHVAARFRGEFAVTVSRPECIENPRKFKRVLGAFCDHFRRNLADTAMTMAPGDCKV